MTVFVNCGPIGPIFAATTGRTTEPRSHFDARRSFDANEWVCGPIEEEPIRRPRAAAPPVETAPEETRVFAKAA